eukprot:1598789-Pyramimonas_sp.AAC.1
MAPKRAPNQLPKPMQDAIAQMKGLGKDVDADGIAALDRNKRRAAFSSLGTTLKNEWPAEYAKYQKMTDDLEKRRWLAAFMVDPECGITTIANTVEREVYDDEMEEDEWVTEDQLGGPLYLNNPRHASIAVRTMISRPFKGNQALQEEGVKQYNYTKYKTLHGKRTSKKATLETKAEMEPEDVQNVREHMQDAEVVTPRPDARRGGPGNKRRRTQPGDPRPDPQPVDMTPRKKAKKEAIEKFETATKTTKTYHDKVSRELGMVALVKQKLERKGWGEAPINFLTTQTATQVTECESLFKTWAEAKNVTLADLSTEAIEQETVKLESAKKALEDSYTAYRKNVLADFQSIK